MNWRDLSDGKHRIYVNDRHRTVHHRRVADDIVAVLPRKNAVVLDFGCGEALFAGRVEK